MNFDICFNKTVQAQSQTFEPDLRYTFEVESNQNFTTRNEVAKHGRNRHIAVHDAVM